MAAKSGIGEHGFPARYASALYALASEKGVLDQVIAEVAALGVLLERDPELARLVANPLTDVAKVAPVLNAALAAQGISDLVRNFVSVTAVNRRMRDLPRIAAGFARYVAGRRGEVVAEVISAQKLTDSQRQALYARLTEAGYGSAKLQEQVDPSLLGGLVLKIGSKLYDTSLKSRLNRLNHSLKGVA